MTGARVHVGGDVVGQLVVGDHNVTVWAEQSVVTVIAPGARPRPSRRASVLLLPRLAAPPMGRDREVADVLAALGTRRLVQVYGPPGIGRSTVLRHVAAKITDPGAGVVFLAMAGRPVTDLVQDVFEAYYDSSGHRPSTVALRHAMTGVDARLLVDDLETAPEELLDCVPDAAVAFTSTRRALFGDGQAMELPGLDRDTATRLLGAALNRPLRDDEGPLVTRLWQATAGSPQLLLRAAAHARRGRDGTLLLPQPAELAELVPRVVAGLSRRHGSCCRCSRSRPHPSQARC